MAVSSQLGKIGFRPERPEATATITSQKVGEHFAITKSHLDLLAQVPGASQANSMLPSTPPRRVAQYQDFSRRRFLSMRGSR